VKKGATVLFKHSEKSCLSFYNTELLKQVAKLEYITISKHHTVHLVRG